MKLSFRNHHTGFRHPKVVDPIRLIASQVDPHTGRVLGPNCSGQEKVRRFREQYPDAQIEEFYSDSHNDDPLAHLAAKAYFVDLGEGTLVPWPEV